MLVIAYLLIAFGGLLSLMNWGTIIVSLRSKRSVSAVPIVGALLLGCGLALLPGTRRFAWVALIADYGTLGLIIATPRIAYNMWSTSRINLLCCFTTTAAGRTVFVKLFRRHIAVISARLDPAVPCDDHGGRVSSFGLVGRWSPTEIGFAIEGYAGHRQLVISKEGGVYVTTEMNYPKGQKYEYDSLGGLVVQKQE